MTKKIEGSVLIDIYKNMPESELQKEIDAFFEIGFALLEATESDSMSTYPNCNVELKFSCNVLQDGEGKYFN